MEALENGKGGRKCATKKLTVDRYLDFIDDRSLPLTVNQLRQIISMHGFKKIQAQQNILTEMVTTMELMDLHRSTLLDGGVSSDASLTLEAVIKDLQSLEWQDCHVTSLVAFSAGGTASSAAGKAAVSLKRKKSRQGGRAVKGAGENSVISSNGTTVAAGSTTETSVLKFNS